MKKERFQEFRNLLGCYDYYACVKKHAPSNVSDNIMLSLFLSKEQDVFIEYGDYPLDTFAEELDVILKEDGYIDTKGCPSKHVEPILEWQVWLTFVDDEQYPIAMLHLFDYTDDVMCEPMEYHVASVEE